LSSEGYLSKRKEYGTNRKTGEPVRDIRKAGKHEYCGTTAVIVGAVRGVTKGVVFACLFVLVCHAIYGVKQKADIIFFGHVFLACGVTVCAGVGVFIGLTRKPAATPLPPDVVEAARTHFTPSAPPPTEDRIKQPDEPGPHTTEPSPGSPTSWPPCPRLCSPMNRTRKKDG
jgi:hypothetical protein